MKLLKLIEGIPFKKIYGDIEIDILDIRYNSKETINSSLFVAIKGEKYDGHNFIDEAISKGATAIIVEKEIKKKFPNITIIEVEDTKSILPKISAQFFNYPSQKLDICAFTGTNGKTTSSYITESIFIAAGYKTGVLGTINYRYNGKIYPSSLTTPESVDLQRILNEMVNSKIKKVIMEVSSHSLAKGRIDETNITTAVFTNLTQDHLDFHKTMENYFESKKKLFSPSLLKGNKEIKPTAILNIDDLYGKRLFDEISGNKISYGLNQNLNPDISAYNVKFSIDGISGIIKAFNDKITFNSCLIGKHNLYNILSAVSVALANDIPLKYIKEGIENIKNVPGRLERIADKPKIFIDYAHTEDALKNILDTILFLSPKRIITVFGCGGERDKGKRPLMGKVSYEKSNITIVTSDNPRNEKPINIIEDICEGIKQLNGNFFQPEQIIQDHSITKGYSVIPDRKSAIKVAIESANLDDVLIIAGKGHEDYQLIGNQKYYFSDKEVILELLNKIKEG